MVEFEIKIHEKQRLAYIPKEIVKALGTRLKAKPDRYALVIYPEDADPILVIKSLEILLEDLKIGRNSSFVAKLHSNEKEYI